MHRTRAFEPAPWSQSRTEAVPVTRVRVTITSRDIEKATWSLYWNPVSIALKRLLNDRSYAAMFWNSDAPAPQHAGDDARIGIHVETTNGERSFWLPLPVRATRAMWNLRQRGIAAFTPVTMALDLPVMALLGNPSGSPAT